MSTPIPLLGGVLGIAFAAVASACVNSEVTPVAGAQLRELPPDCPLREFPSTTPDYPWEDVATVRAICPNSEGRSACIEQIRSDACRAGGDTVYGYKDGIQGGATIIVATIARRIGPGSRVKSASGQKAPPSEPCDPPCSPGYRCQGGTCAAVCNPPCNAGMHCAQDRTCQPDESRAPNR
jgi:hypothetical protein